MVALLIKPIRYLRLFHAVEVKPDMVFLFSEKDPHLLRGKVHYLLAPFLKSGKYTAHQIVDALEKKLPAAEVYYAIERLKNAKLIETSESPYPPEFSAFCQMLGKAPELVAKQLKAAPVFLTAVGKVQTKPLEQALRKLGAGLTKNAESASLTLIVCDDYLNHALTPLYKKLCKLKKPYLLAKPIGSCLWLGPLFNKDTGCGECMRVRIERNRIEEKFVRTKLGEHFNFEISSAELPTTAPLATNWIATEIFKLLLDQENAQLKGTLLTFDLIASKLEEHKLVKLPKCRVCGKKAKASPLSPLILQARKKGGYDENGNRCIAPEETINKHLHLVSPILGPVKYLKNVKPPGTSLLHMFTAGHNFAISNGYRGIYRRDLRSESGGKGKTETQAKASALGEAIERYSGQFFGHEQGVRATMAELKDLAIHPYKCLHYSQKQYAGREKTRHLSSKDQVPYPFDEKESIDWTPVWSLTEKRHKYFPTAFCYYGFRDEKRDFCGADSNGNAAGNTIEEAVLQGFFELAERDAVAIWWYNRLRRPQVDLSSFKDPYITELLAEYKAMKREIWVLDIRNDLNIPTFAAFSRRIDQEGEEIHFGFGAHLQPEIALIRALTEMNQMYSFAESWKNLPDVANEQAVYTHWQKTATIASQPYLKGKKIVTAADFPRCKSQDLMEDILHCQKIVEDLGMEMLVLDQTQPEIDLKVVKVIVPGLRHFWSRFAPGRLYDVPVKMGWLKRPLKEEELNPIPMFL